MRGTVNVLRDRSRALGSTLARRFTHNFGAYARVWTLSCGMRLRHGALALMLAAALQACIGVFFPAGVMVGHAEPVISQVVRGDDLRAFAHPAKLDPSVVVSALEAANVATGWGPRDPDDNLKDAREIAERFEWLETHQCVQLGSFRFVVHRNTLFVLWPDGERVVAKTPAYPGRDEWAPDPSRIREGVGWYCGSDACFRSALDCRELHAGAPCLFSERAVCFSGFAKLRSVVRIGLCFRNAERCEFHLQNYQLAQEVGEASRCGTER